MDRRSQTLDHKSNFLTTTAHIISSCCCIRTVIETLQYSLAFQLLQSSSLRYLRNLIALQPSQSTRSSALVTLLQPSIASGLNITKRSFRGLKNHFFHTHYLTTNEPLDVIVLLRYSFNCMRVSIQLLAAIQINQLTDWYAAPDLCYAVSHLGYGQTVALDTDTQC